MQKQPANPCTQPLKSKRSHAWLIAFSVLMMTLPFGSALAEFEATNAQSLTATPATVESVDNAKQGIINTLIGLITGLMASANDLIYRTTPSSVVAMNTNSSLVESKKPIETNLFNATENQTKFALTGAVSFLDPIFDKNALAINPASPTFPNSALLVFDIYNTLNSELLNKSSTLKIPAKIEVQPEVSKLFEDLMTKKTNCKDKNDCSTLNEPAIRQKILDTIFDNQGFSNYQSYLAGDQYYNPESLFSDTPYTPNNTPNKKEKDFDTVPLLIDQLDKFGGTIKIQPSGLPEPLIGTELQNVETQTTNELSTGTSPTSLEEIQEQQELYTQASMQLIAAKNFLLNNFHFIHIQRIAQPSIIAKNIKDPGNKDQLVSNAVQLENYAANRRLRPEYYQEIAAASPTAIARENLFVLSEIRQQLHQNQVMSERLLATLSILALSSFSAKQKELGDLDMAIKNQIKMLTEGTTASIDDLSNGDLPADVMAE